MTWGTSVELCIDICDVTVFTKHHLEDAGTYMQESDFWSKCTRNLTWYSWKCFYQSSISWARSKNMPILRHGANHRTYQQFFNLWWLMAVFRFISGKSRFQIQVCYVIVCEAKSKLEWMQSIQMRYVFLLDLTLILPAKAPEVSKFSSEAMSYEWSYAPTNRAKCKARTLTMSPPFVGYGWLMKNLKVLLMVNRKLGNHLYGIGSFMKNVENTCICIYKYTYFWIYIQWCCRSPANTSTVDRNRVFVIHSLCDFKVSTDWDELNPPRTL